jgi:fumarylacetoacetate (FAA) hydrolase
LGEEAMKLATLNDGTRDGRLAVVSRDLTRGAEAKAARTMQDAIERWSEVEPLLQKEFDAVNGGAGQPFDPLKAMAPLPRAWQWLDGSAFHSHGDLMAKVFGMDENQKERPLMYQGVSDRFYGPSDDIPMQSEADGIDFEGEVAIIVDETPAGANQADALDHIKLIIQLNDWSLRVLAPVEMRTGFGWIQAKPPCSAAAVAVTPDELGEAWKNGRVGLPLSVKWNGEQFGAANAGTMDFGFHELVAHAARTRTLVAGTIIGSGTISNANYREVGSSCIAERRGIEIEDFGAPKTAFMKFGDRVQMEARGLDGSPMFGPIDQVVVKG